MWTVIGFICIATENLKGDKTDKQFLYLHGHREVVLGFRREENIHSFLWKRLIPSRWSPNFNDVQLEANRSRSKSLS